MSQKITDSTWQAHVDDQAYQIEFKAGELLVNDQVVEWSLTPLGNSYYSLIINGKSLPVVIETAHDGTISVTAGSKKSSVKVLSRMDLLLEELGMDVGDAAAEKEVRAPMPGLVLQIGVSVGDEVSAGQALLVLEAMKMENELKAPADGIIKAIHAETGVAVDKNALLIEFE